MARGPFYGPVVGGLFLAFPAIFPATATLVEKHESARKAQKGLNGLRRVRAAASEDAAGAIIGSIGLLFFGGTMWWLAPHLSPWLTLTLATLIWLGASASLWMIHERV